MVRFSDPGAYFILSVTQGGVLIGERALIRDETLMSFFFSST